MNYFYNFIIHRHVSINGAASRLRAISPTSFSHSRSPSGFTLPTPAAAAHPGGADAAYRRTTLTVFPPAAVAHPGGTDPDYCSLQRLGGGGGQRMDYCPRGVRGGWDPTSRRLVLSAVQAPLNSGTYILYLRFTVKTGNFAAFF